MKLAFGKLVGLLNAGVLLPEKQQRDLSGRENIFLKKKIKKNTTLKGKVIVGNKSGGSCGAGEK